MIIAYSSMVRFIYVHEDENKQHYQAFEAVNDFTNWFLIIDGGKMQIIKKQEAKPDYHREIYNAFLWQIVHFIPQQWFTSPLLASACFGTNRTSLFNFLTTLFD